MLVGTTPVEGLFGQRREKYHDEMSKRMGTGGHIDEDGARMPVVLHLGRPIIVVGGCEAVASRTIR